MCIEVENNHNEKIGGPGIFVEIKESPFLCVEKIMLCVYCLSKGFSEEYFGKPKHVL